MAEIPQIGKGELKKGEIKFIETFESIHKEKPSTFEHPELKRRISETLEHIRQRITKLPEVQHEQEIHPQAPISQMTNLLAQAVQIALEEGVEEGLRFIKEKSGNNPYLIDAFHDLLVGHFMELLMKKNE